MKKTKQNEIIELQKEIQKQAEQETFSIDKDVYQAAGRDPLSPILLAGSLESPLCFFARDLGKDEVHAGQPLYGAAGRLVRGGIHHFLHNTIASSNEDLQKAASCVLLTNTVPYKPIDNKAYPVKVKERFRPFLVKLLMEHWQGKCIISLGSEALQWFEKYDTSSQFKSFMKSEKRFTETFTLDLKATTNKGIEVRKSVILAPLPHPSPLNQKYYTLFPQMLAKRLECFGEEIRQFACSQGDMVRGY